MHDHFEMRPAKRQRVSDTGISRRPSLAAAHQGTASPKQEYPVEVPTPPPFPRARDPPTGYERTVTRRENEPMDVGSSAISPAIVKSKRVRTGCLTCRNRHLKCDEAMPICLNCQKSNRKCERGVRLNFIDLKVEQPPVLLPPVDWKVQFQDESRLIASEYVGGLERYAELGQKPVMPSAGEIAAEPRHHRPGVSVPTAPSHFVESSRPGPPPSVAALYYSSGTLSRPLQENPYAGGGDQMAQTGSRKGSGAFLAMGSGPTPASSHSGHGGRTASFSQGTMHEPYAMRDEAVPMMHSYRSSDVSSVASSLVAQGVAASSSGSYRHATGSGPPDPHDGLMTPQSEKNGERDYLSTPEEIHYMQVFIDEVAVWMDSLDNQKHFGRVIPYLALKSPMLLNAFLACGVKHLTLVDGGSYKDDKALYYYDTATTQLLRNLQNPERNTAECATTAVVLNVYEIMSERPAARIHHIAGARALIRECKWNATSSGIGAACFWLNVGMEILSCLAFNWATAWDPDHWGVDPDELMNMKAAEGRTAGANEPHHIIGVGAEDFPSPTSNVAGVGEEETWVHRILYITAKVANFRANIPSQFQEPKPSPHDEQVRLQSRFAEWQRLKNWCDSWNANCPRSMRPYGYLFASSTNSVFPNVWLIKRAAIVGRLFYHTAMCLLAQISPIKHPHHDDETRTVQLHHAHQVCGIVANTKDKGASSVAIRALAVAGCVLTEQSEQHEVLAILNRTYRKTGWNLKRVTDELRKAWGWDLQDPPPAGGAAAPGVDPSLPAPASALAIAPAAQGGTLGAALLSGQHFAGPRDPAAQAQAQAQDARRPSHPHHLPPAPLLPQASSSFSSTPADQRHRRPSLASTHSGPPHPHPHPHPHPQPLPSLSLPSHPAGFTMANAGARQGSIGGGGGGGSSSGQPSPAGTVHTPASASSTAANAATPPSRPMVNPLLAQADFNQPNHPYREWYKPPEKGGHNCFGSGEGGSWHY